MCTTNQNEWVFEIEIFQMILTNIIKINIDENFCNIIETITNILKIKKKKHVEQISVTSQINKFCITWYLSHILSYINIVFMLKFIVEFRQSNNAWNHWKKNQSRYNKQNDKISKYLLVDQMLQKPTLHHWQKLQSEYSALIQMMTNVLIVLIANVDVERNFNIAQQIINYIKVQLLLKIIKQLMMLKKFSNIDAIKREKLQIKKIKFSFHQKTKND